MQTGLDAVRLLADDDRFMAVICDGLGGVDTGESVAAFCADEIIGTNASSPLPLVHQALRARQQNEPAWATARSTAAALALSPKTGALSWTTIGDTRVYLFQRRNEGEGRGVGATGGADRGVGATGAVETGAIEADNAGGGHRMGGDQNGRTGLLELVAISPDDSAGYAAYLRGETDHEGIRLFDARDTLTASLGGEREPLPHTGTAQLGPGDAVLVCSDGFWEYVFDVEMLADLTKATGTEEWLRLMLLRLTQRSYLAGDALSAVACRVVE
jgi:serine/threonine protein phosphatase PrpC